MSTRYDVEKQKWDEKAAGMMAGQHNWHYGKSYDDVFTSMNTLLPVYRFFDGIGQPGVTILDYGCGRGWATMAFATKAEKVKGFDISEQSVELVRQRAASNHFDNVEVVAADGEALPYEDGQFDYVFGNAILHHLQLDRCLPEIYRVMKRGGRAAFCEPLAHNPAINLFRYLKHHVFMEHVGTDRPLKYADKAVFEEYFDEVNFEESSFLRDRIKFLIPVDRMLLKIPFLRPYVAYVTVLLKKK